MFAANHNVNGNGGANAVRVPVGVNSGMALTDLEVEWAWEIKDAILEHEDVRLVSDYEIAQLSVVTLGSEELPSVLERAFALQCLRDEYHLHDTPEEAVELVRALTCDQQPGHVLAFDLSPDGRHYIGVFDFAANRPSALHMPNDWRIYLGAYYYLLSAACPKLRFVREGFVTIAECEGMGYHSFSPQMQQRWAQELGMYYPVLSKESLWFNTPTIANVMCAFVKPWLNSRTNRWDQIQLGCRLECFEGRIDVLMNTPNQQAAQQKLFRNLHTALTERYHHCRTYVLPPSPSQLDDDDQE
jgi:CRAL/TRIO domain